ncbi:EARP-interacting protein homolog [Dermatophagoides pteronyssinus]|uniref:EARP-interacting protein homolog n=1 Tax=Dermatophagoides pteronyssinus TaxID=6956 RepID=UPI003F66ED17
MRSVSENPSLIYGLDHECRALCSQYSEHLPSRFFVGTQSLKSNENYVHLLEYIEESNSLLKAVFRHSYGEIWHMISFSKQPQNLLTCYSSLSETNKIINCFTLWHIPIDITENLNENENAVVLELEKYHTFDREKFDENFGRIARLKPDDENELILCLESKLAYIDLETQQLKRYITIDNPGGNNKTMHSNRLSKISTCNWSPHFNSNIVTIVCNNNIYAKDLRISSSNANNNNVWQITQAHSQMIRDMDFNPNSQHYLATGGDDCQVKFWDIRDTTKPILKMLHHTHWVWSVRYNSFHDHLVLSSSSDGNVNLLRISSIASQPYGQLIEQEDLLDKEEDFNIKRLLISSNQQSNQNPNNNQNDDGLIKKFEDHADSVYSIEWSPNDPWIFASLSYDGRLIINKVPDEEKMNIFV